MIKNLIICSLYKSSLSNGACLDRFNKLLEFLKDKNEALRFNLIESESDMA